MQSIKKKTAKKKVTSRKVPEKILNHTLYCYVENANGVYARKYGRNIFGSFSAYVNALIAKDRGVKPKLGTWKVPGESKYLRDRTKTTKGTGKILHA